MTTNRTRAALAEGMLFKFRNDTEAKLYRIVQTGGGELWTHVSSLEDEDWPEPYLTEELYERLAPEYQGDDALEFVREELDDGEVKADSSPAAKTRYDWISELVKPETIRAMFSPSDRSASIKAQAAKVGKSVTTLKFQLKRFFARGMTVDALEGDTHKCGGKGKKRNPKRKVGAKRTVAAGVGTPVNKDNISYLETAASYVLGAKGKRTLREGLDFIKDKFCRDWPVTERFTIRQLQWYIRTKYPYTHRKRRKHGDKAFELSWRSFKGSADTYGPGAQFQIDSTIADVYLVSVFNRLRIVGRPTIYIVSDTFSRMIVGACVSFSPPCRESAALALESVVTPKVALCLEYGFEIEEKDWPAHHLPKHLLADRGSEFTSIQAWDRIVSNLLVDVANTTAFRPDWKSIVESRFNLIDQIWGPFVPGHVENDFKERGGTDYRLDAVLTLREFTAVFLRSVVEYNNRPLRTKTQIPEMVASKIKPTPVELWNFGVANRSGTLKATPLDRVRACVYPRGRASVSHLGIGFATRFYETPRAIQEEWFDKARKANYTVDVAYDPENPEKLFVIHADQTMERTTLRKTGPQYDDTVCLTEIYALKKDAAKNLSDAFDDFEEAKQELRDGTDAIIAKANAEREAAMAATGTKKLDIDGIRDAKAAERELLDRVRKGKVAPVVQEVAQTGGLDDGENDDDDRWSGLDEISIEALEAAENRARYGHSGVQR